MKSLISIFRTNNQIEPLVIRVLLGAVMFPHGAQKVFGWFGGHGFEGTMGFFTQVLHIPALFAFLAIMAEFAGAIALVMGLFTRVAAFGISITMAVAALMVHLQNGFFMNWSGKQGGEGIEYHLLAIAAGVALMISGGGRFSLDQVISRSFGREVEPNAREAFAATTV